MMRMIFILIIMNFRFYSQHCPILVLVKDLVCSDLVQTAPHFPTEAAHTPGHRDALPLGPAAQSMDTATLKKTGQLRSSGTVMGSAMGLNSQRRWLDGRFSMRKLRNR